MADEENPIVGDNPPAEEDRWEIFKSKGIYELDVEIANHEQLDIFSGSIKRILPIKNDLPSDKSRAKVLLMALDPTTLPIKPPRFSSIHVPEVILKPNSNPGNVFGLSRDIGISLYDWVGTRCREVWEHPTASGYVRFEQSVRKLGRWFTAGIFEHHDNGSYVEKPLESAFVQEKNE